MRDLGTLYPAPAHPGKFVGGSTPYAISPLGQIIGVADTDGNGQPTPHAFLWTPGGTDGIKGNRQMKDLGVLHGGLTSMPLAINVRGVVIGTSDVYHDDGHGSVCFGYHAFLYSGGILSGSDTGATDGEPSQQPELPRGNH